MERDRDTLYAENPLRPSGADYFPYPPNIDFSRFISQSIPIYSRYFLALHPQRKPVIRNGA